MKIEEIVKSLATSELSEFLLEGFQEARLEELAKETGFIERRTSQLTGAMFLALNMSDFSDQGGMSLTEKCEHLFENHGVEMKKQSLDERYNTFAVKFMRKCFEQAFTHFTTDLAGLNGIDSTLEAVFLSDATSFQLPAQLSHFYSSNGGSTSGASIKIHQTYELLKGQIHEFDFTDGKDTDPTYWERCNLSFQANSLYIADLGYYKLDHFAQIEQAGAYWLSRYKTKTNLYIKAENGELTRLNLIDYLDGQTINLELPEVYLGKEKKLPCRLLIQPVPEEVKQERLEKLRRRVANHSKNKGAYQSSPLKAFLCGFNLFITNLPAHTFTAQQVVDFYGLRWQIELLFKIWKSLLAIDKVGRMSIFRFECHLYGKLILLLLTTQVKSFLEQLGTGYELELSEWKTVKYLKKKVTQWCRVLARSRWELGRFLTYILQRLIKIARKERRRRRNRKVSPFEILKC